MLANPAASYGECTRYFGSGLSEIQKKSTSVEVRKLELSGNVEDSIKRVEGALKKKDFKEAADLISLLQESYDTLPSQFDDKERVIKQGLEKIREEFTHDQVVIAEKEMHKLTSDINHALAKSTMNPHVK